MSAAEGPGNGGLDRGGGGGALLESIEELDDSLGCQVLVEVVVDLNHRGVDAGA